MILCIIPRSSTKNNLFILRGLIVISLFCISHSSLFKPVQTCFPCFENPGICFPITNGTSGSGIDYYSHIPATKKPLRVILFTLDNNDEQNGNEEALDNLVLHFQPVVQMMEQNDYEVVDLEMSIEHYKFLSKKDCGDGQKGFMEENFPYLKRFHLSWDGAKSTMEDDFLDGLEYLEEFKLKGLPGLGLPRVGNFLSPFANDAAGPLKNVILDCKTCDFSSLKLGTVTSLERFELINSQKAPSVDLAKISLSDPNKEWIFPSSIRNVKLTYANSLQWLCGEYQKVKQHATIMAKSTPSSNSSLKLEMYLNNESISAYQCEGMMDAFFNLPRPVLPHSIAKAVPAISSSTGLYLRKALVDKVLVQEILNREWGALYMSGGWAIPLFWFPKTASEIGANIDYALSKKELNPIIYIPYDCVVRMCTAIAFTATHPKAARVGIYNLKSYPDYVNSSIIWYSNSLEYVHSNNLFMYIHFPHLKSYMEDNLSGDGLFSRTEQPWGLLAARENVQNMSLGCKEDYDRTALNVVRKKVLADYVSLGLLAVTCEISSIDQNALMSLPLHSLWIHTSGLNERATPAVFPLLGSRSTNASHIHFDGLLTPNVTMPLYHESVKESFFTHSATFRNGRMKEFNIDSLGTPPCNNVLGYCNGLKSLDVSFNNLTTLVINWAKSFEVNSLTVEKVEQQLVGKNMFDSCKRIRISDDIISPVFESTNSPRNLTLFYSTFQDWEKEYERPISTRREIAIDIRDNRLEELSEGSFGDLRSLSVLYASGNSIWSVSPGFLHGKSCMASGCIVDLSNNSLGDAISSLGRNLSLQAEMGTPVTALGLGGNSIDTFPFGVGKFLLNGKIIWKRKSQNIFHVDLSNNNITHIDNSICSGMSSTTTGTYVVDLSHNDIAEISGDAFDCPVNVDLHVYLNGNPRLRVIPDDPQLLKSLVSLNLINTGLTSENIPCVYQMGEDETGNKLRLWSLGLGKEAQPGTTQLLGSASVKSFDCCVFVQLKRHYSVFNMNNFPPSMRNSNPSTWDDIIFKSTYVINEIFANVLNPNREDYRDFQCGTKELGSFQDNTAVRSFGLFFQEYQANKGNCVMCGTKSKPNNSSSSLSLLGSVYACLLVSYIASHLVALIENYKKPLPPSTESTHKHASFCLLLSQYSGSVSNEQRLKFEVNTCDYERKGIVGCEEGYCEILQTRGNFEDCEEPYYASPYDQDTYDCCISCSNNNTASLSEERQEDQPSVKLQDTNYIS
eukprot:Nk52_evm19s503 gene=Nk52_evmTU19s503